MDPVGVPRVGLDGLISAEPSDAWLRVNYSDRSIFKTNRCRGTALMPADADHRDHEPAILVVAVPIKDSGQVGRACSPRPMA